MYNCMAAMRFWNGGCCSVKGARAQKVGLKSTDLKIWFRQKS